LRIVAQRSRRKGREKAPPPSSAGATYQGEGGENKPFLELEKGKRGKGDEKKGKESQSPMIEQCYRAKKREKTKKLLNPLRPWGRGKKKKRRGKEKKENGTFLEAYPCRSLKRRRKKGRKEAAAPVSEERGGGRKKKERGREREVHAYHAFPLCAPLVTHEGKWGSCLHGRRKKGRTRFLHLRPQKENASLLTTRGGEKGERRGGEGPPDPLNRFRPTRKEGKKNVTAGRLMVTKKRVLRPHLHHIIAAPREGGRGKKKKKAKRSRSRQRKGGKKKREREEWSFFS